MASKFDPGVPEEERSRPSDAADASPGGDPARAVSEVTDPAAADLPGTGTGATGAGGVTSEAAAREARRAERERSKGNMLPARGQRRFGLERILVRIIATIGVITVGVVIAAIMTSSHSQGWIIGLVVATVSVALSAVLWSSKQV
jgi:hypothetical protein